MIADTNNSIICSQLVLKDFISELGGAFYSNAPFNTLDITHTLFNNFSCK